MSFHTIGEIFTLYFKTNWIHLGLNFFPFSKLEVNSFCFQTIKNLSGLQYNRWQWIN